MPSLSDKLRSLGVHIGADNIKTPASQKSILLLTDVFDGAWKHTPSGDCFVVKNNIQFGTNHGRVILNPDINATILEGDPGLAGLSSIPIEQYLFIDTETTGLSGGTGSYVFLIGAARFINKKIEFAQFFLDDPAKETAQLAAFDQFSSAAKVIISYNGKSFDLPRLRTRYKFHAWPMPFEDVYHIDLLHIVRRIWKDHLSSCSLGDIEHHLLGVERSSLDVPGWQVASLFFEYIQSGDPNPLTSVFYHNELDVISLIALLIYIIERLSNPTIPTLQPQDDQISIGLYLLHLKQLQTAMTTLSYAIDSLKLSDNQKDIGMYHIAQIHKRNQDFSNAVTFWKKSANRGYLISPNIELAMYYEHKEKDYPEAIHWTLSAIELVSSQPDLISSSDTITALNHRLSRLKRKISPHSDIK